MSFLEAYIKAKENVDRRMGSAGKIVHQDSGITCDRCNEANYMVVVGWESDKAYKCPRCGQYYYWVGNVLCTRQEGTNPPPILT